MLNHKAFRGFYFFLNATFLYFLQIQSFLTGFASSTFDIYQSYLVWYRRKDNSVVRLIDRMVLDLMSASAKISLRVWRLNSPLQFNGWVEIMRFGHVKRRNREIAGKA